MNLYFVAEEGFWYQELVGCSVVTVSNVKTLLCLLLDWTGFGTVIRGGCYDKWIYLAESSTNANILSGMMTFSLVLGCHWGQNRGPWSLQLKFSLTSLHSVLSNQPVFTSTSRSLHHCWLFVRLFLEHETSEVSTRTVFTAGDCYVLATAVGPQRQL